MKNILSINQRLFCSSVSLLSCLVVCSGFVTSALAQEPDSDQTCKFKKTDDNCGTPENEDSSGAVPPYNFDWPDLFADTNYSEAFIHRRGPNRYTDVRRRRRPIYVCETFYNFSCYHHPRPYRSRCACPAWGMWYPGEIFIY